jgi:hypothetical protein
MILNGVYSEENDTCTYGGGSGSSGGGEVFYCFGINGGSDRLCYSTQDECENTWMVRNPDSDPDVLHCFTQNTPN